ncbi:MAG: hypothetical protein MJ096_05845 [Clostridia bacterium]|nr:hypothetical protein [Clostridia bacterium]
MNIERINTYDDQHFSQRVRNQHGCFLVDGSPYEVEIISEFEAVVRGERTEAFAELIEEYRFYTPHITRFCDSQGVLICEYPEAEIIELELSQIQPSQFFVDTDKINAVSTFIHASEDIIIPVMRHEGRYVSLDGHTRLHYAVMQGWNHVRAVMDTSDDWVYRFVTEAQKRGVFTPNDMKPVSHEEYEEKWNRFCDSIFAETLEG